MYGCSPETTTTLLIRCVCACVTPRAVTCQAPLSMELFQARILERVAISFSRESSQFRNQTHVSGDLPHFLHWQSGSLPAEPWGIDIPVQNKKFKFWKKKKKVFWKKGQIKGENKTTVGSRCWSLLRVSELSLKAIKKSKGNRISLISRKIYSTNHTGLHCFLNYKKSASLLHRVEWYVLLHPEIAEFKFSALSISHGFCLSESGNSRLDDSCQGKKNSLRNTQES